MAMACAIFSPASSLSHSSSAPTGGKPFLCVVSNSGISVLQDVKCIPQLGFSNFSQWNGLKHLGISISQYSVKIERKGKCKGKGVYASLFGVGAPEALVIGVVALLIFGPKGLAEIARNLGKTLREFQPTIRELQEVSRDFKSTLEREIGLDDSNNSVPKSSASNTIKPPMAEDEPQDSGTDIEPDSIPSEIEEESNSNYVKMTQAQLIGALTQLKKEQQEEKEKVESQAESQNDSQDNPEDVSSLPTPTQSVESSTLEEAVFAVSPGLAPPKPDSET